MREPTGGNPNQERRGKSAHEKAIENFNVIGGGERNLK